jgi:lipopolysaccharide export system permease protein
MSLGWIKRADKLVARQVLVTLLAVWAVLIGLDVISAFVSQLDDIGKGNYSLTTAITYVAWTIPRRSYQLFGAAAVLGGVIGLGALAPTSELTALRAAGWSKRRLAGSALVLVAIVTIPVMWIGDRLGPAAEMRAQGIAVGAKSQDLVVTNNTGMWARDGQTLLNAKQGRVLKRGIELIDVRLYRFDPEGRLLSITRGALATHEQGSWIFSDVTEFRFEEQAVTTTASDRWAWKSALDPQLLSLSIVQPRYQRLSDLRGHIAYLTRNDLDASAFESAFWSRIFYPLSVLAPLMLALPLVFGTLRSGGFGKRLFLGIIVAVAYFAVLQPIVVNATRVSGLSLPLAYTVPPLLLMLFGWWRLGRTSH